jgi:hypothetical protein
MAQIWHENQLSHAQPFPFAIISLMADPKRRLAGIYEELSNGRISEQPLVEHLPRRKAIRGFCAVSGVVTINPIPDTLDTLIHELFHRRFPHWSERYVKQQTTLLIRAMSPEEQQTMYDTYLKRRTTTKRKKAVQ